MKVEVIEIKLVRHEVDVPFNSAIRSSNDAADILKAYIGDCDREHFVAVMLDTKNKVAAINTVSIGSLNSSIVHPREVFKAAILHNSNCILLGHNHPSGVLTPSSEDLITTNRLVDAGNILGIKILDHIIVSESDHLSFLDKGFL